MGIKIHLFTFTIICMACYTERDSGVTEIRKDMTHLSPAGADDDISVSADI